MKDVATLDQKPHGRLPKAIFVRPFTFTEESLRVDRQGADLESVKFKIREHMTKNLVRRLPRYVAPAKAVSANAPLPRGNYWEIRGNFDRVSQGSRFLRSVVGFGAGGTRMDTTVVIYDLSRSRPKPFLRISTTGGSNISPGVLGTATYFISGPTALTSLFNAVEAVRSGITFDTIRTTRELNAALSEYLYQRGVIPYEEAVGPKRLGQLPDCIGYTDRGKKQGPTKAAAPTKKAPADSDHGRM